MVKGCRPLHQNHATRRRWRIAVIFCLKGPLFITFFGGWVRRIFLAPSARFHPLGVLTRLPASFFYRRSPSRRSARIFFYDGLRAQCFLPPLSSGWRRAALRAFPRCVFTPTLFSPPVPAGTFPHPLTPFWFSADMFRGPHASFGDNLPFFESFLTL